MKLGPCYLFQRLTIWTYKKTTMSSIESDQIGDLPSKKEYGYQQRGDFTTYPNRYRKDSVVSFTSTNSETKILPESKQRSISTSSYPDSESSSTQYANDKVQIAKLKLLYKVGLSIIIPLIILLTIVVVYLFITVQGLRNERLPQVDFSHSSVSDFCVECSKLQMTLPEENVVLDKLTKKMDGGVQLCCAETAEQNDVFIKRYLDVKLKEERASGGLCMGTSAGLTGPDLRSKRNSAGASPVRCTSSNSPSVHLIGDMDIRSNPSSRSGYSATTYKTITEWVDNADVAFRNGVSFNKKSGTLIIPKAGFYYIYSQVHFMQTFPSVASHNGAYHNTDPKPRPDSNSLTHSISRTHHRFYHEPILKRRQSECWVTNKRYSEYTSYLGGIINLRAGDEIYVEVSNKSKVSTQPKMNFFGLFYVSPNENTP